MEKLIIDATSHIRNVNKKKLTSCRILNQINNNSASNWELETINDILAVMKAKNTIEKNFYLLNQNINEADVGQSNDEIDIETQGQVYQRHTPMDNQSQYNNPELSTPVQHKSPPTLTSSEESQPKKK